MNRQLPYIRTSAARSPLHPPFFSFSSPFFPQPPRGDANQPTPHAGVISSSILRKIYDTPGRQFITPVIANQPLPTVYTTGRFRPPRDYCFAKFLLENQLPLEGTSCPLLLDFHFSQLDFVPLHQAVSSARYVLPSS